MANLLHAFICLFMIGTTQNALTGAVSCTYDASTCLCKFEEEVILDVHQLIPSKVSVSIGNLTYTFSGCKNLPEKCHGEESSLCLRNVTANATIDVNLGAADKLELVASTTHLSAFDVTYKNTKVIIALVCSPDLTDTIFVSVPQTTNIKSHNFAVFSQHACKVVQHPGMSTGSKLLIMFFVFILFYFTLGALILYFMRGARGLEMIPNIDFWRDLPALVRDGALYLLNGCNPVVVPTAETYDRI